MRIHPMANSHNQRGKDIGRPGKPLGEEGSRDHHGANQIRGKGLSSSLNSGIYPTGMSGVPI